MIIYPPLIKESAPAFLYHDVNDTTSKITIPFEWNPAVPQGAGINLKLLIKEYFTSTIIASGIPTTPANSAAAIFHVEDTKYTVDNKNYTFPQIGLYYKLQIAYDDGISQELVYSSVALGKCISNNITLQITDLEETLTDQVAVMENCVDYKGIYLRDLLNEPLYSYLFDFKDLFGNVLESSGEVIWNNENDECIFEGWSKYNSSLVFELYQPGTAIRSFYDGHTETESIFNKTDQDGALLINNTIYTETVNLALKIPMINGINWTQYGWASGGTLGPTFDLKLGSWTPTDEELELIKKYNITATRTYDFSHKKDVSTLYNTLYDYYFNSSSITVSSIYQSIPTYHLKYEPLIGQTYTMDFTITTINGYKTTISRTITKQLEESPIYNLQVKAIPDIYNDGYIELSIESTTSGINGLFSLERKETSSSTWEVLTTIKLGKDSDISLWSWKDFSVKLNTEYQYRLRQFNKGLYSMPMGMATAQVNAEDILLSDGKRQLKICFNPKVSSMKETILETKTDTIGNKYPIFYRNGLVRYREIPISGLISYLMDDNQFFMSNEELGLVEEPAAADIKPKTRTTNLVDYNIYAERVFREEVLKWLNDGKPKLFRSPTEGNFIVRLMNVSLSPNETVGRMLWTFSATAYEIADTEFETLKKLNLLNILKLLPEGTNFVNKMWLYLSSNNNATSEVIYNVKNITWSTLVPVQNAYITLYKDIDDILGLQFHNFVGLFETPQNVIYAKMTITDIDGEMLYSTINYQQNGTEYDASTDNFGTTILEGVWASLSNGDYTNVYYLSFSRTNTEPGSVFINNNEIIVNDNQARYYYDIGALTIANKTDNIIGTIYYGQEVSS